MADREKLDNERPGITKKFKILYTEDEVDERHAEADPSKREVKALRFYVTANTYADGRLAEVFIRGDKIGGFLGGALDTWAIMFSMAMQHGIPMATITEKLRHQKFGPRGRTADKDFPSCTSMFDLIAQWLDRTFPDGRFAGQAGREPPKEAPP